MTLLTLESSTTAIAWTEREIALMQEYRTRLTADVVTGKLYVRPAAAHLPALPATTEPTPDISVPDDQIFGDSEAGSE